MSDLRIHIDDATGKQIASPDDATNGGSYSLKGEDAKRWLKANPDRALPAEEKAQEKPEDKEAPQASNKAAAAPKAKPQK